MPRRPRVLVTGASGLLGGRLAELLASAYDVIAMRHHAPVPAGLTAVDADLLEFGALARAVEAARPEAVLHSAALADADRCEAEPDLARRCNVEASAEIARLCHARGLRLIALSTDLVLGGDVAFSVEDPPARPILVYGRTKRDAEEAILDESPHAAVLRVALVIGRGYGPRTTASESIAAALVAGRRPRLFDDQYRTPIDPESIADAVGRVLEAAAGGRFHLGGAERLTRYELGQRVAQVLGLRGSFDRVSQASQAVRRPADTSLDSSRARRELGWTPRPLDEAIRDGRRPAV
ncbi:MAG TPA: SDR family oxidoreductase [Vicinamibacteria bacterium]